MSAPHPALEPVADLLKDKLHIYLIPQSLLRSAFEQGAEFLTPGENHIGMHLWQHGCASRKNGKFQIQPEVTS
ncbi:MAG TPA: hypothetical protein VEH27_18245 [Methylomirabilota bacterium]|nr:hypothetical protein [Methylomirabilota bacterium]